MELDDHVENGDTANVEITMLGLIRSVVSTIVFFFLIQPIKAIVIGGIIWFVAWMASHR